MGRFHLARDGLGRFETPTIPHETLNASMACPSYGTVGIVECGAHMSALACASHKVAAETVPTVPTGLRAGRFGRKFNDIRAMEDGTTTVPNHPAHRPKSWRGRGGKFLQTLDRGPAGESRASFHQIRKYFFARVLFGAAGWRVSA